MRNSWLKRLVGISLVIVMLLSATATLQATNTKQELSEQSISILSLQGDPRFKYLSTVISGLEIDSNRIYYCQGSCTIFHDYDVEITVTLQVSSDKLRWSNVTSWTESFSGMGSHDMQKRYYHAYDGKYYQVLTTVKVLNSSGGVIETGDCVSPISQ